MLSVLLSALFIAMRVALGDDDRDEVINKRRSGEDTDRGLGKDGRLPRDAAVAAAAASMRKVSSSMSVSSPNDSVIITGSSLLRISRGMKLRQYPYLFAPAFRALFSPAAAAAAAVPGDSSKLCAPVLTGSTGLCLSLLVSSLGDDESRGEGRGDDLGDTNAVASSWVLGDCWCCCCRRCCSLVCAELGLLCIRLASDG